LIYFILLYFYFRLKLLNVVFQLMFNKYLVYLLLLKRYLLRFQKELLWIQRL